MDAKHHYNDPHIHIKSIRHAKAAVPINAAPATALKAAIIALVARNQNVSPNLFFAPTRCRVKVARARQLAMYLLNVMGGFNMVEIGALFGRDRSTVSYACSLMEDQREDGGFDAEICALESEIEGLSVLAARQAKLGELTHAAR